MKYPQHIREEELKNKVAQDFFGKFDTTEIIKDIDFAVRFRPQASGADPSAEYLLWAEAKRATADILGMLAQLVLTIGKARTFDAVSPPAFLGCFDYAKIAFVPYADIQDIFYQNDFNWNVAPSDHTTREFRMIRGQIERIQNGNETFVFDFEKDEKELMGFIRENFTVGNTGTTKIRIDKNNFITIYNKWSEAVKPTIQVDWDQAKKKDIIAGDFYLADLLSDKNESLKDKLFVLLKTDHYELDRKFDESGFKDFKTTSFADRQKAHKQFWAKYERPPLQAYWDYILGRRDLLVPQDVRERKGSFFTPQIWVELSQKYIADVLGMNWQDEYYVWDCAAGTGNLLTGLTNKDNIWASTLDKADVDVMKDRIRNGANLWESQVFQFDFLNDDFTKLPQGLQDIINDPEKRKKLVVYINPPYAETMSKGEKHKAGLNKSMMNDKYKIRMGAGANRELFIQFLTRIYCEIQGCIIANFSTLKILQSPHFASFRDFFAVKPRKLFLVPANTFDNVKGEFPIGFFIWDTAKKEKFDQTIADIYLEIDKQAVFEGQKTVHSYDGDQLINNWIITTRKRDAEKNIGFIACLGNDFQQNNIISIFNDKNQMASPRGSWVTDKNITEVSVYFAVRKVIPADWLNDRDQFLYPNDSWKTDVEFQNDCLAYTLFNNNIQSGYGPNHWIPFTESEVGLHDKFGSRFMADFIGGKIDRELAVDLFSVDRPKNLETPLVFSPEAAAVFAAGRKLWSYYHIQPKHNVNASLYDIREYFQGRNEKGKMNNKSGDETYNELIGNLRSALRVLAKKIVPKVYEHGFLKA